MVQIPTIYLPSVDIGKRGVTRRNDTWNDSLGFDVSDEFFQLTVAGMHGVNDSEFVELWHKPVEIHTIDTQSTQAKDESIITYTQGCAVDLLKRNHCVDGLILRILGLPFF